MTAGTAAYHAACRRLSFHVTRSGVLERPVGRGARCTARPVEEPRPVEELGRRVRRHLGWRGVDPHDLLRRVVDGDERAWDELVEQFAGLVWSVARTYRLSAASTDDVVQTVWLRLAEHCGRIRQPERLASWLATTTRNEALRVIRGNARLTPSATIDDRAEPTTPSIEERVGDDETMHVVLAAFAQLSDDDQQLLRLLCAVPPIDYQTIAEVLGRPIGSIGPTRARCIQRLRKLLPAGFDVEGELS